MKSWKPLLIKIARNKLSDEKLKEKKKNYPKPSICEALIGAKKGNKAIWSKLMRSGTRGKDLKFQQIQSTLIKAITPLVILNDKLFTRQENSTGTWADDSQDNMLKALTDAVALILRSNAELSQRRLDLIRPDLKQYQQICSAEVTESSTYLFRDDLVQKIKYINATNRVGQTLNNASSRGNYIVAPPIMALLIPAPASRIAGVIPEPPNDVIASTNEYRSFMKDGKLQVHFGPTLTSFPDVSWPQMRILTHGPILPSQTLTEGCFKKRTSATFKVNFIFEETLTLMSRPERPF